MHFHSLELILYVICYYEFVQLYITFSDQPQSFQNKVDMSCVRRQNTKFLLSRQCQIADASVNIDMMHVCRVLTILIIHPFECTVSLYYINIMNIYPSLKETFELTSYQHFSELKSFSLYVHIGIDISGLNTLSKILSDMNESICVCSFSRPSAPHTNLSKNARDIITMKKLH